MLDLEDTDMTPDEIEAQTRLENEMKVARREAFGQRVARKRDEAVEGRASSGIEETWVQCEEFYQGIDDANRGEAKGAQLKPLATGGSSATRTKNSTRSTVFLNITRPYVDAASAKISDMLLPTDDKNWGVKPTPIPTLVHALKDQRPIVDGQGQPMFAQPQGPQPEGQPPQEPKRMTVADMAKKEMDAATEKATAAEKRIEDWHVECQYNAEVRKVIEDTSKLGTGVLKGPFPMRTTRRATQMSEGGITLMIEKSIAPCSKRVDPWNAYPDPACGESIHDGQYFFEKDLITERQLKELKGTDYLDDQIDSVIEEGPGKRNVNSTRLNQDVINDKEKYEIWYGHMFVDAEDLEVANINVKKGEGAFAMITLVNDRVIKAVLQPLEGGEFPYDMMPWQRRPNMPWGIGIAEQIRTPQRMLNAACRNLMDNAGLSAGGQIVMRRGAVEPADGSWALTPRKFWYVKDDADIRSVQDAFAMINLPSFQQELMAIMTFAQQQAENVTGLPALLQGQQGQAPETVGGMTMLMNNASSVLRRLARTFDDCITSPHIRRYYQWLLEFGEDDNEKGDFVIHAYGSTALVERDMANQALLQMGAMVMNPAFGINPAKYAEELLKAQKIDPKRLQYTEEEKQKMAQQPAPVAPQIEAAKIRAEVDMKKLEVTQGIAKQDGQLESLKIKSDTDRDTAWVQAETQRTQVEANAKREELMLKRELEMLKYANEQKISLDAIKAQLAAKAADIQLERDLAGASNAVKIETSKKPPLEPHGKAPNGQAWAQ